MANLSPVLSRFLRCVQTDTASRDAEPGEVVQHPSTPTQLQFMDALAVEIMQLGVPQSQLTTLPDGSMLVSLPATPCYENAIHVCLAAHVDTSYECAGKANPIIHEYAGGDIVLPYNNVVIPAADLTGLEGKRVITADGTSLLGADDKGGVASLVTLLELLVTGSYPHGRITFWFCVDEEIGQLGITHLNPELVASFDLFLTVDGKRLGEIDIGGFYCRKFQMIFHGENAHPGEFPKKLHASHVAAIKFLGRMMNLFMTPWDGIEYPMAPFFYFTRIEGSANETRVTMLPRAFDLETSDEMVRTACIVASEEAIAAGCTFEVITDEMLTMNNDVAIAMRPDLLAVLHEAHRAAGVTTSEHMVRGGTDGGMLNKVYPTIPTPNMGYGGCNFHGPQEFLVADELEQVPGILADALGRYSKVSAKSAATTEAPAEM